jgi:hypothetical protein
MNGNLVTASRSIPCPVPNRNPERSEKASKKKLTVNVKWYFPIWMANILEYILKLYGNVMNTDDGAGG